jgi:hypothetical protein
MSPGKFNEGGLDDASFECLRMSVDVAEDDWGVLRMIGG